MMSNKKPVGAQASKKMYVDYWKDLTPEDKEFLEQANLEMHRGGHSKENSLHKTNIEGWSEKTEEGAVSSGFKPLTRSQYQDQCINASRRDLFHPSAKFINTPHSKDGDDRWVKTSYTPESEYIVDQAIGAEVEKDVASGRHDFELPKLKQYLIQVLTKDYLLHGPEHCRSKVDRLYEREITINPKDKLELTELKLKAKSICKSWINFKNAYNEYRKIILDKEPLKSKEDFKPIIKELKDNKRLEDKMNSEYNSRKR